MRLEELHRLDRRPEAEQRYDECCKKSYYGTAQNAQFGVERGRSEREIELRYYKCRFCSGYHLTSKGVVNLTTANCVSASGLAIAPVGR